MEKKLNKTKAEIEENKFRLNDEGTQASNMSFMSLSGDQGLSTEETQETEEIGYSDFLAFKVVIKGKGNLVHN